MLHNEPNQQVIATQQAMLKEQKLVYKNDKEEKK
jgi:hypothetical protein